MKVQDFTVDFMRPQDVPAVRRLEELYGDWSKWAAAQRSYTYQTYVARGYDGQIVGAVAAQVKDGKLIVRRLVVASARWRQGIGAALVDRLRQLLPGTFRQELVARTSVRELDTNLFLRATGFTAVKLTGDRISWVAGPPTTVPDTVYPNSLFAGAGMGASYPGHR